VGHDHELRLSAGVNFAWQIAADEAIRARHQQIEPTDLLLGVCSVGKLLTPGVGKMLQADEAALALASAEWEELASRFRAAEISAVDMRRKIRAQLPPGNYAGPEREKVSRSEATVRIFEAAEQLASARSSAVIRLLDILSAILASDNVDHILQPAGVSIVRLRSACESVVGREALAVSETALAHGSGEPSLVRLQVTRGEAIVTESLDATVPVFSNSGAEAVAENRAATLSELCWQLASGSVDLMLQDALQRLMAAIPAARRGAILLSGKAGEMLLKAHVPAGAPAVSLTLVERAIATRSGLIWQRREDPTMSQVQSSSEAGIYAPLIWNNDTYGAICVDTSDAIPVFTPADLKLVVSVAHQVALLVANDELTSKLRRNATLLERLLTNFSPKTRSLLLTKAEQGKLRLGGVRSEVTILCSDIRGFTKLAAAMDADEVVDMLNAYLSVLVGCIFQNEGTVDKFIGDAILAVFGSPEPDVQQHANGLAAAMAMQDAIRRLNQERAARGEIVCEIGIGVHCGSVVHGFIGTHDRMEFTVIGDAVNKASRYCAAASAGEVIVSPELHQHVWKIAKAEAITIDTKHEGALPAYRVHRSAAVAGPAAKS
jgi:class 3 adenylate cyclase